ncbi:chorismate mutase [Calothrix rhizosoleniae]|uniref:chorismate mutase n=1 Tax=Calothrix rhizosoleniae TaxID=888997 RepID=UPI0038990780
MIKDTTQEDLDVEWQMRAIRGATTVSENTTEAMRAAVMELLDELEQHNQLHPTDIISITFSVTKDLDAIFPAAIARTRPSWDNVPMLDVQQMYVEGSLKRCIRFLLHTHLPVSAPVYHIYLRNAASLRPDWSLPQRVASSTTAC